MINNKRWLLTDTKNGIWTDSIELGAKALGVKGAKISIVKKTLRGGLCDGVDVIEVNNGALSFTILPTRGMGIWKASYGGMRIGWDSPVNGPVHPKFVNLPDRGGLGWLAGFDEMMVRCGLESNGAPCSDVVPGNTDAPARIELGLHGKIANIPAHYVEVSVVHGNPPRLQICGVVDEAMLFCPQFRLSTEISTGIGSGSIRIVDTIVNLKSVPSEMELLYHCNFGPPVLEEGARLLIPSFETAPRDAVATGGIETWHVYGAPVRNYSEQCFYHMPLADARGNSLALLENASRSKGVAVRFNTKQLPYFTQWKNTGAESDGYVTGLEPATNYPNPKSFERARDRVVRLGSGHMYRAEIAIEAFDTAVAMKKAEREIANIAKGVVCKVFKQPQPSYSRA